ncbi:hypothetical protein GOV04_03160 [Candidatus Woesearchaeota archaeon]|nr:hypothetical protein [Candidatus Woesearchaeota archaeon]
MKSIVFDTGPIISLTTNNLLWLLKPLKELFGGEFYIPESVKKELVDKPFHTKQFKFEALQVLEQIKNKTLVVLDDDQIRKKTFHLLTVANSIFSAHGTSIKIVHFGEMEALATAIVKGSLALVVDERTTRKLVEDPAQLHEHLQRKLHTKILVDNVQLKEMRQLIKNIGILRSVELATMAYEHGFLDKYLPHTSIIDRPKKALLESVLWGIKLNGCAVRKKDIDKIVQIELKKGVFRR